MSKKEGTEGLTLEKTKSKGLLGSLKSLFVTSGEETAEVLKLSESEAHLKELEQEIASRDTYINEAVKGKHPNFDPAIDIAYFHHLNEQVEAARAAEKSFWENILEKLIKILPILLFLLPDDHPLKIQFKQVMDEHAAGDEVSLSTKIAQLLLEMPADADAQSTQAMGQLQKFVTQYQEKERLTTQAVKKGLAIYETRIADFIDRRQAHMISLGKHPDAVEQDVTKLIKEYEGRKAGVSNTPASDRFSVDIMLQQVRDYRVSYETKMTSFSDTNKAAEQSLFDLVQNYLDLLTQHRDHLVAKQTHLEQQYVQTKGKLDLQGILQAYQQAKKTRYDSRDILQAALDFLRNPIGKYQYTLVLSDALKQQREELRESYTVLSRFFEGIERDLYVKYEEQLAKFRSENNIQRIANLQHLQVAYHEKFNELMRLRVDYKTLEHALLAEGVKLSRGQLLESLPETPSATVPILEIVLSSAQLEELYNGFAKSIGLPGIHLKDHTGSIISRKLQDDMETTLQQTLFKQLTTGKIDTHTTQVGNEQLTVKQGEQGISELSINIDPEAKRLMHYRKNFRTQMANNINHPEGIDHLIKLAEEMIRNGEFTIEKQNGLSVFRFETGGFSGGFVGSDQIFDTEVKDVIIKTKASNKALAPDARYEISNSLIRRYDSGKRTGYILEKIDALKAEGIVYDENVNLKSLVDALIQKGLTASDALTVYMYLTGQYGEYRIGKWTEYRNDRTQVELFAETTRKIQYDYSKSTGSLLFFVPKRPTPQVSSSVVEIEIGDQETRYLRYAPAIAKNFFMSLSPEEKKDVMKHVEYLEDGIRFLDDEGQEICVLEKENISVTDKDIEYGKIEKVDVTTYFESETLMNYAKEHKIQFPTREMYEKILAIMPARDYMFNAQCKAPFQLYKLLGCMLSGSVRSGKLESRGRTGELFILSDDVNDKLTLYASGELGYLMRYDHGYGSSLRPARALKSLPSNATSVIEIEIGKPELAYLKYASVEVKRFFKRLSEDEQKIIKKHVEYLPDGIRFLDDKGQEICVIDNKDLEVPESVLGPGSIEKNTGTNYFDRSVMMDYIAEHDIQVPDEQMYETLLRLMPAQDYTGKEAPCKSFKQLYHILGGKPTGFMVLDKGGAVSRRGEVGVWRTSSSNHARQGVLFQIQQVDGGGEGLCQNVRSEVLAPARALKSAPKKAASVIEIEIGKPELAYLRHAPVAAKTFFNSLDEAGKKRIMKHVEYLEDGIRFLDDAGKEICIIDNKDFTVPDSELSASRVERRDGKTYFSRNAISKYAQARDIKLPTDDLYEKLLRLMPAQDFVKRRKYAKAGDELGSILGFEFPKSTDDIDYLNSCIWTGSAGEDFATAFQFDTSRRKKEGPLTSLYTSGLLRIRVLKSPGEKS